MSAQKKLFSFQGGIFTMITKEKEVQNDKERILKKFNFFSQNNSNNNFSQSQNSGGLMNKSVKISRNKSHSNNKKTRSEDSQISIKTISKPRNHSHLPLTSKINTRNKKNNGVNVSKSFSINHHELKLAATPKSKKKSLEKKSTPSIANSNETERDNENHMVIVNNSLLSNSIKINQEDKMSHGSIIEIERNPIKEKTITATVDPLINKNKVNNYLLNNPITSSEESENISSSKKIPQYQQIQIKNKKIQQLFTFNQKCDIPSSLINDELNNYHVIGFNTEYKFIDKIREENYNFLRINLKSFLKLSDYSLFYLLSYCYENYNNLVFESNKYVSSKINLTMNNIFHEIIIDFSKKYKSIFQLIKFNFVQKNNILHKRVVPVLNLVIKAKIISKEINKCYEIGYNYISQKKEFENIWKFDIKSKSNICLWFSSECEIFNENPHRFCYSQPIFPFTINDTLELNINIYSKNGCVNPFSIKWKELKIEEVPGGFYQKSMLKCPYNFNKLRACEVENMIHFWRGENTFIQNNLLITEFKNIFKRHFKIQKILYDFSKIYLYKIKMKAESVGKIIKNKFVNFDFEIVPYDSSIQNEIQNLFLLNSNLYTNQIQVRVGTIIIFYLTEL